MERKLRRIKKYIFNMDINFISDFKNKDINTLKFLYLGMINLKESNYIRLKYLAGDL